MQAVAARPFAGAGRRTTPAAAPTAPQRARPPADGHRLAAAWERQQQRRQRRPEIAARSCDKPGHSEDWSREEQAAERPQEFDSDEEEPVGSAGAPPASTGHGAAYEPEQAAAPPPPPPSAEGGKLSESDRDRLLVGLAENFSKFQEEFAKTSKQVTAVARGLGANSESLARMSGAIINLPGYWPGRLVTDVDDMLSMVSCNGWRAKQEDVIAKLLADHCGYFALEEQLLRKLGAQVPEVGILISQFEGSDGWRWDKKLRFLHKVEVALKSQQPQQPDDAGEDPLWWRAYMSALQGYCAVAAAAGNDPDGGGGRMRDFLLRPRRAACPPLVMMVVALATGQLRTSIEFDGEPRLSVHNGVASVEIMEAKTSLKGLPQAREQLEVAGRTVVWLLHAANQELLAATRANRLHLRGVMAVQGRLTAEERNVWEREVDVSCPGLNATMQLEMLLY